MGCSGSIIGRKRPFFYALHFVADLQMPQKIYKGEKRIKVLLYILEHIMNTGSGIDPAEEDDRSAYIDVIRDHCEFYCVCFENPEKKRSMTDRFRKLGLDLVIYGGVPHSDPRIANGENRRISPQVQRLWSVTYGHLDMIRLFYDSGKTYGLFCEDDIVVSRQLPKNIPFIMQEFDAMRLDVLLLGYMKTFKVEGWMTGHELKREFDDRPYTYHNYPDDQWGVHLYMLGREGAKKILDAYASGFADENPEHPFSPDWTISKVGNRALISPMFAVEDGRDSWAHYNHQGQFDFHINTFKFNYIPDVFI
jgi:hypothetical protein